MIPSDEAEFVYIKYLLFSFVFFFSFSEGKLLRDDEILQNLPVGTTATMYFRDLGPQLGWTMVCIYI